MEKAKSKRVGVGVAVFIVGVFLLLAVDDWTIRKIGLYIASGGAMYIAFSLWGHRYIPKKSPQ